MKLTFLQKELKFTLFGKVIIFKIGKILGTITLMVLTIIFTKTIEDKWEGVQKTFASKPYVAVLISQKTIDFDIPIDFMDGFNKVKLNQDYFLSKDGKKVQIKYEEDFLLREKTILISEILNKDKNCIMAIGNATSTLTDVNMDIFLKSKNRLPFIMPIATDNGILKKAQSGKYNCVLRMLPNNDKQADTIERLVSKFAPKRKVAIYGDQENPSYSINLSRDIAEKIRKKGGKVLVEEAIGPLNSFYNSITKWTSKDSYPEVIIYVGVSHHGLLLLDQISELNISIPFIFTDGCLVPSLLSNSAKYSGRIFILSPAEFKEEDRFLPSYNSIGEDAYFLAKQIIQSSDGTRESLRSYIENHKMEIVFNGRAGRYGFDDSGNNVERDYIVYEMVGGRLIQFNDY